MNFFDTQIYMRVYGKSAGEVSPTDPPKEAFQISHLTCPECGSQLDSQCNILSVNASCEDCHLEIIQKREYILDDPEYHSTHKIIDEREKYLCPLCKDYHPITEISVTEETDLPNLSGYDNDHINCICGNTLKTPDSFSTPAKCSVCQREYSLNLGSNL